MTGVMHEAGNDHSCGTPVFTSYAKALNCVVCSLIMIISLLLSCLIGSIRQHIHSRLSPGSFVIEKFSV